jgi:hypothetical protein
VSAKTEGASALVNDIELRQSAFARVARVRNDEVNAAWQRRELPFHKDAEGFRVSQLSDVLVWIQQRKAAPASGVAR